MKSRFFVAVYRRAEDLVVVPQKGTGGVYYEVEPVARVARDVAELAGAIEAAIAISEATVYEPPAGYKTPVLKALGVKSYKKFAETVRDHCFVMRWDGDVEVELWRPARDGRGFEPGGKTVALSPSAGVEAIARAVLEI